MSDGTAAFQRFAVLTSLILFFSVMLSGPSVYRAAAATLHVVIPVEDARVKEAEPTKNFGTDLLLHARSYPGQNQRSYLRFEVSGLMTAPDSVVLRLFNSDPSPAGGIVRSVLGAWSESTITWANAPALGSMPLATIGTVVAGTWAEVDLTDTITANGSYDIAVDGAVGNLAAYSSSEGAEPPQLVILGGDAPAPPVSDFDATPVTGAAPLDVAFRSLATGQPSSWEWDFDGDGLVDSTERNPRHLYTSPGAYDVTLTVANTLGSDTLTRSASIVVNSDSVLVGAGDIADCLRTDDASTAALIDQIGGIVFTTGDNAYPHGSASDFSNCYAPTWGRHLARTRPTIGNHDYETQAASAYFGYFGPAAGPAGRGYYSYDVGAWHVVVLDGNCTIVLGGCGLGSPQEQWLRSDLTDHSTANVLAMWHQPRFNSGAEHGNDLAVAPFWDDLYEFGADVVVNGHEHVYERFAPQTPSGGPDAQHGIRQFTVGTGGADLYSFSSPQPNSEVRYNGSAGVLKLTLGESNYSWEFIAANGAPFTDSGTALTHGVPPPQSALLHIGPEADARVKEAQPKRNFGEDPTLQVRSRAGQSHRSYITFAVSGLSSLPDSVRLRLFTTDGSADGGTLYAVTAPWSENTITWNLQPPSDPTPLRQLGAVVAGTWADIDVTSLVIGDGTYRWVLISGSSNAAVYDSSEGSHQPELLIDPGS